MKDGKFYTGSTSNLDERLKRHLKGYVKATKHRRPMKLVHSEEFSTKEEAIKREYYLKRLRNTDYFREAIIGK